MNESYSGIRIGYVMTGSFCTFERSFRQAERLREMGAELVPVMSENAAEISTRFGTNEGNIRRFSEICGKEVITTIAGAEPIGPSRAYRTQRPDRYNGSSAMHLQHSSKARGRSDRFSGDNGSEIASSGRKACRTCDSVERLTARLSEEHRRAVQPEELLLCADASGRYRKEAGVARSGV